MSIISFFFFFPPKTALASCAKITQTKPKQAPAKGQNAFINCPMKTYPWGAQHSKDPGRSESNRVRRTGPGPGHRSEGVRSGLKWTPVYLFIFHLSVVADMKVRLGISSRVDFSSGMKYEPITAEIYYGLTITYPLLQPYHIHTLGIKHLILGQLFTNKYTNYNNILFLRLYLRVSFSTYCQCEIFKLKIVIFSVALSPETVVFC